MAKREVLVSQGAPRRKIGKPPYKVAWLSPCWFRGGLETVTITHLRHMRESLWRHHLVLGKTDGMAFEIPDGVEATYVPEAFEWSMPPPDGETYSAKFYMRRALEDIKPDVVIGALTHAGMFAAREAGVPLIVEYAHCGWGWDAMHHPTDRIIPVSEATLKRMRKSRRVSNERAQVILNGVDTERFRPDAEDRFRIRRQLGIPQDATVVGFVGRIAPEKQPLMWVEALAQIRDAGTPVVGLMVGNSYSEGLERQLRQLATIRGLTVQTDLLRVSAAYDDMPRMYRAMDLLMHTRTDEPFGMILVESILCGVPVVGFAGGGMPEIAERIGDGIRLVRVPTHAIEGAASLAGAASYVLKLPAEVRLPSTSIAAAQTHFSGARMSADLEALLLGMIEGRTEASA